MSCLCCNPYPMWRGRGRFLFSEDIFTCLSLNACFAVRMKKPEVALGQQEVGACLAGPMPPTELLCTTHTDTLMTVQPAAVFLTTWGSPGLWTSCSDISQGPRPADMWQSNNNHRSCSYSLLTGFADFHLCSASACRFSLSHPSMR